eukprot:NODE_10_length_61504_cov_0.956502.p7 type:complete len:552 gc:universal NODE_10_length_61504_cov_0.956502:17729-16074(-)
MSLKKIADDRITAAVIYPSMQNIIFELILNSIEAKATTINICISKEKISIIDDGCGIEDVTNICLPGATSKPNKKGISLYSLNTICALEISSRCREELVGKSWKKGIQGNRTMKEGTIIEVSRFYENLPVRQKYLMHNFTSESMKCLSIVQNLSLLYEIEFSFDKTINGIPKRLYRSKGEPLFQKLSRLNGETFPFQSNNFNGFISFGIEKETKILIVFNGLPLLMDSNKSKNLNMMKKSISELFKTVNIYKYFISLYIKEPSSEFLTSKLSAQIIASLGDILNNFNKAKSIISFNGSQTYFSNNESKVDSTCDVRSFGPSQLIKPAPRIDKLNYFSKVENFCPADKNFEFSDSCVLSKSAEHHLEIKNFLDVTIIGQFNLGFILCTYSTLLYIIDQHASSEIFNYENLISNLDIVQYPLLIPKKLDLNPTMQNSFDEFQSILETFGFRFVFEEEVIYVAVIPILSGVQLNENDIHDIIEQMQSGSINIIPTKVKARMASKACRMSVMIGDNLNHSEMERIVHQLATLNNPWNCPHGRPTVKLLSEFQKES